jgi:drug/metabolite transporter (DMT)-like permease
LGSAAAHATWNLIIEVSGDRDAATLATWCIGGLVAVPVLCVVGPPEAAAWPFLLGGATVQVLYAYGLSRAYTHGDFSLAYPIARGSGALLVALGGTLFFGDHLGGIAWLGIAVVAASLLLLVRRGATLASFEWALYTGAVICAYQLLDAAGTRRSSSGVSYGMAVAVTVAVTVSVAGLVRGKGPAVVAELRTYGGRILPAGVLMTGAYTMVLVAFHDAPIGYVSVLREASVVVGALLGWLFLKEGLGRYRVASSLVMVAGLALLVIGG